MIYIENGTLICPHGPVKASLAVDGGCITAIGQGFEPLPKDERIDASGCLVFPGFIDAHTHLDMDSGVTTTADDFTTGSRAAISGGTTTIVDFATQTRGGSLQEALESWHAKADGKTSCDYGFHMAICDWNPDVRDELPVMVRAGVTSFKMYMAYDALAVDDAALLDALCAIRDVGGVLGVHCENGRLIDQLTAQLKQAGQMSPAAHPKSRPPEVEAEAVNRLLNISQLADWPVHIVHISSRAAMQEVRRARMRGQRVYVESCPQYLLLDDSRYGLPGFEGAKYVMSPPLRSQEDRDFLCMALAGDEIDTISTDHCSYRYEDQKMMGREDFSKIPNGGPGIEHRPALIYNHFIQNGAMSAVHMNRLLSENPARLFGMFPKKGAILQGADADLVIWNPNAKQVISAASQYQNTDYTPYEGMEVCGRADWVLLGGKTVVREGRVVLENTGRYLPRSTNPGLRMGIADTGEACAARN